MHLHLHRPFFLCLFPLGCAVNNTYLEVNQLSAFCLYMSVFIGLCQNVTSTLPTDVDVEIRHVKLHK